VHEKSLVPWWPTVRREVTIMRDVLALTFYQVNQPISRTVFASDAMGAGVDNGGFGIVGTVVADDTLLQILHSLRLTGRSLARSHLERGILRRPDRRLEPTIPFSLLPRVLFDENKTTWTRIAKGRWKFADAIALGESRAVIRLLQMLARNQEAHGHQVLNLEDNMVAAYSFAKGRSSTHPLNFLLRRRCALCLASNLRILLPWLETDLEPADGISREL